MTIKPVTSNQKQNEKKDSHDRHGVSVGVIEQQNQQNVARSSQHRNVVIDGHCQSPQRRSDVYDELSRHRRSPHKSGSRTKRGEHHHHKRERAEREKISTSNTSQYHHPVVVPSSKCSSPHLHGGGKSPEHLAALPVALGSGGPTPSTVNQAAANLMKIVEDTYSGYNSGDEHLQPKENILTADEWQRRDEQFSKCMSDRGFVLKPIEEDGACLFRAISLQIYGDEEMHDVIRQQTMDYIYKNREYFSHFVTEDINSYIKRKRRKDSHGNHIEIQAMSEIYNRPVELYCYKSAPINIFNSEQKNNGFAPLRLSYQRGSHYNAILDPYNATVGVGLGLAGYKPELQTVEAARISEQLEIEQTMFEDKLKTTDWEATNEAIEEQIARESYLLWCRDNLQKSRSATTTTTYAAATAGASASSSSSSTAAASGSGILATSAGTSSSSTVTSAEAASTSPSKSSTIVNQRSSTATATSASGGPTPHLTPLSSLNGPVAEIGGNSHFGSLSPKSLTSLAQNLKKQDSTDQLGFDSDDTDMSSTSSVGNNSGGSSPSSTRGKKSKNCTNSSRGSKKRRREAGGFVGAGSCDAKSTIDDTTSTFKPNAAEDSHKSPKRETLPDPVDAVVETINLVAPKENLQSSPTFTQTDLNAPATSVSASAPAISSPNREASHSSNEQLPSTSKQSATETRVPPQPVSIFYQSLLESSYGADGMCLGQLTESEMLQRAIQLSTQDYIDDQKRKITYRP